MALEPLVVTAHLVNAYEGDDLSPSLDGILAYWLLQEQLGEEEFAMGFTGHRALIDPELPLGKETFGSLWWWQCSSPISQIKQEFLSFTHRRFDDEYAYERVPNAKRVETKAGAYKAYRNGHRRRLVKQITWHCLGDATEIRRLLRRCSTIGKGHTHGYGQLDPVTPWTVEPGGDASLARFYRPLPVMFAEQHQVTGPFMLWGVRPPGRLPENQALCVIPSRG